MRLEHVPSSYHQYLSLSRREKRALARAIATSTRRNIPKENRLSKAENRLYYYRMLGIGYLQKAQPQAREAVKKFFEPRD